MKKLFLCFLFVGCAQTQVREAGKVVFTTQMNCASMSYRSAAGSTLTVTGMNHSTPTRAGGSVIGTTGTALVGVATAIATKGLIH